MRQRVETRCMQHHSLTRSLILSRFLACVLLLCLWLWNARGRDENFLPPSGQH